MKKTLVVLLVALLCVGTAFAATSYRSYRGASKKDTLSLGLNIGTDSGFIVNYGMGKFDIEGVFAFGFINGKGLHVEGGVAYEIVDVADECNFKGEMPFTLGGTLDLAVMFGDKLWATLGVLVPAKLSYTFDNVPISLYLRLAPGLLISFKETVGVGFAMEGSIGATYSFDL